MAQLFAKSQVKPTSVRAVNTVYNKRIFESGSPDFENTPWATIFKTTPPNSKWTAPNIMISNETQINENGRAYFKPVAVLTNALCYSACELFTASIQDWKIGKVYGEGMLTFCTRFFETILKTYFIKN
jgi:hypothetical protein